MKFSHENLQIWQLGMKLLEVTYSLKNHFLEEDKFGLWDQIVRSTEAIPRDISEGYGKSSNKERALYMERAKNETAEVDTSYKEAVKKGRINESEYEKMIKPLIKELYFKIIGYRKWVLRPPSPSAAVNHLHQAQRSTSGFTLIEIIMVVFIFGIIIAVGGNLLFSILKGASKVEISKDAKQSGDYALGVMERAIRNAQGIIQNTESPSNTCTVGMKKIKIQNKDKTVTEFYCEVNSSVAKIASKSGSLTTDYLTGNNITLSTDNTCGVNNTLTFDCDATVNPPKVAISFTLIQKNISAKAEDQASVSFKTTVFPRIYK
jgi:four helix bundle protein